MYIIKQASATSTICLLNCDRVSNVYWPIYGKNCNKNGKTVVKVLMALLHYLAKY